MSTTHQIQQLEEERRVLKVNTDLELERITKQLLKLQVKEFIEQHKEVFEKSEQEIPSRIRLSYYSEYDDEGGTEPHIGEVYLYDEKGDLLDTDLEVFVKTTYQDELIESTLEEELRDLLYRKFETIDIEQYIGEEMIVF